MESRSSFTAETVALLRAFESYRPPGRRLFCDPYAAGFLRLWLRVLAEASRVPVLRGLVTGLYDLVAGPGPRSSAVARTKVIDDAVVAAMSGATQCVLLGAGFDTRAHRLPALAGCRVFEVDHPATQSAKRDAVDRLGLRSGHVSYVPVDFEVDDLAMALAGNGFDPAAAAVFVWEGVTNYLTADAVDATLAVLRKLGGSLVLTYVDARALHEPSPFPEARRWVRAVARAGEPWTFGLLPTQVGEFLAERGFRLRADVSAFDAGQTWFAAQHRREQGSQLYRIAIADVIRSTDATHL
ncbi:methyltransferase (TIGR00027 family) [Kibdelosporangium banguiense]|uniref:S-adenosyl-L-methionine-dependent methyltransferase n=1 Tax=Kibdelosporangium banguiense TaxID=1365924 RepID=A0ABS4U2X6_9PSEU|nr:SAM-dependent methyltransferase [Kibdelosporangium banguiense]MBP2330563.1 methyltransferase (TIGR00027 family) [Kibdelosporangium banguiense]